MKAPLLFDFTVDADHLRIQVQREFDAPADLVWRAWTEADILDRWWAPKPWRTETRHLDLSPGGHWLYAMRGPEGECHWCRCDYDIIESGSRFVGRDGFCDEQGVLNAEMPLTTWEVAFHALGDRTRVEIRITTTDRPQLDTLISMGFREGFSMGMENLDAWFATQDRLKREHPPKGPRVSVYLNFNGRTEEAFRFYQSVFKTAFIGGMRRFGDLTPEDGHPPIDPDMARFVIHVELPILGGCILMGTDAPEQMGFTLNEGNMMHINLEPGSREEADRIFNALAEGGTVLEPLKTMFWGGYYGSLKDRYGIHWMMNV